MKSFTYRLKTIILTKNMLASIVIGTVMLLWNHLAMWIGYNVNIGSLSLKEMGSVFLDDIYKAYNLSGFGLFIPFIAVLPAATLFCEDYNSGYITSILGRMKRRRYITESIANVTLSGGLAVFIPCFLSYTFFLLNGKLNTVENMYGNYSTVFDESVYSEIQYIGGGLLLYVFLLILAFMTGAVWAMAGYFVSTITTNRYIVLAAPFVIYFTAHLVLYRTQKYLLYSPINMIFPDGTFIPSPVFPFLYQIVLGVILCIGSICCLRRKLYDL